MMKQTLSAIANAFTGSRTPIGRRWIPALLVIAALPLDATPPSGFTSQTFRGPIAGNVFASQWDSNPLFNILIQSSTDPWGYDIVQGTTTFAPADSTGTPSQSGWHDHPTALSIGLVVQGTVWSQEESNPTCLVPIPTGTVFFERSGRIHNNYNLDRTTAAIVRIIHFVDRNQPATRRDRPDPISGSTTTATPPPPVCPASPSSPSTSPNPANRSFLNSFAPAAHADDPASAANRSR